MVDAQSMSSQGMKLGVKAMAIRERKGTHQMKIAVFVKFLLLTLAKIGSLIYHKDGTRFLAFVALPQAII